MLADQRHRFFAEPIGQVLTLGPVFELRVFIRGEIALRMSRMRAADVVIKPLLARPHRRGVRLHQSSDQHYQ